VSESKLTRRADAPIIDPEEVRRSRVAMAVYNAIKGLGKGSFDLHIARIPGTRRLGAKISKRPRPKGQGPLEFSWDEDR